MTSDYHITIVLRLLCQGLTINAIAKWMRGITSDPWTYKKVEKLRWRYGRHIKRPIVFIGDPGTGEYQTCRFCDVHTRMPCIGCAIKAMRRGT